MLFIGCKYPTKSQNGLLCPKVKVEQRTYFEDDIVFFLYVYLYLIGLKVS